MEERKAPFLREVTIAEEGPAIRHKPKWHGVAEMPPMLSMRPSPRQDEFITGARARREVSSLSDSPHRSRISDGVVVLSARNSTAPNTVPLPALNFETPGGAGGGFDMRSGSQSARDYSIQSPTAPNLPSPIGARMRRGAHDGRPSNRSDAALLSWSLANELTGGLTYRQELAVHNAAFQEVTRQVAVHCSERGEVLGRLRAFYTKSSEVTIKLAEKSIKATYEEQIASLQKQLLDTRQQLRDAQSQRGGQMSAEPDKLVNAFHDMNPRDKKDVLVALMEESGDLLLTSEDGYALPAGQQAESVQRAVFSHCSDYEELRGVYAALAAQHEPEEKCLLIQAALGAATNDERFGIIFDGLDYSQRKHMIVSAFEATIDSVKGPLIADCMHDMKKDQIHATLIAALQSLESHSTTKQEDFLRAWAAKMSAQEVSLIVGGMLSSMKQEAVASALVAGVKQKEPADGVHIAQQLLLHMPKADSAQAILNLLDNCKPAERRLVLSAILEHTANKDLPMLLPNVLSRGEVASVMGSAASGEDFLGVLSRQVKEMGPENGGKYVGTLYRALPIPVARCACLKEVSLPGSECCPSPIMCCY